MIKLHKYLMGMGCVLSLLLLPVTQASATLIGDDVDVVIADFNAGTPNILFSETVTVVDGSVELVDFAGGYFDVDIEASSISIFANKNLVVNNDSEFLGFGFLQLAMGVPGGVLGFDLLNSETDIVGLSLDRLFLDPHNIGINFEGLTLAAGNFVTLGLTFTAVPEPSVFALLLIGVVGMVFVNRRRLQA